MAYVPKLLPEDQENQFARTEPTTPVPQASGSAGSGEGGAAPGVGTSTQFGSSAAKLSDYLKANKSQIQQFGQELAGDLTNRYNQTRQGIDQGFNQFTGEVGASYTPPDPTRVNQALQDPAAFVKDSQNMQDWQTWYNPSYGGPQNFEGSSVYSNLNNQVNKAVENASLVNTLPGIGTYIQNYTGRPNYTSGMGTLDAALLQRNPEARQSIQEAAKPYQNLSGYLGEKTAAANQAIQAEKDQVRQTGESTRAATQRATDQFSADLQNRLAQRRQQATNQSSALRSAFEQGAQLTNDEMKMLGIDPATWSSILNERNLIQNTGGPFQDTTAKYGGKFDLLPYFMSGNPETAYNLANVATPDEYAREAALQALTQNQFNLLPEDSSFAGTAPQTLASFDANKAAQDVYNQRRGLDQSVIDQYKNWSLGAYDEPTWKNMMTDPTKANSYQQLVDIYNRNEDLTSDSQKQIADRLQQWITEGSALPPTGGDALTQPTDQGAPTDGNNYRVIDGQMKYWDGTKWTDPPSVDYTNPDDSGKIIRAF